MNYCDCALKTAFSLGIGLDPANVTYVMYRFLYGVCGNGHILDRYISTYISKRYSHPYISTIKKGPII